MLDQEENAYVFRYFMLEETEDGPIEIAKTKSFLSDTVVNAEQLLTDWLCETGRIHSTSRYELEDVIVVKHG